MAVFITGGYGQLGSWLSYRFAEEGKEVIVLDVVDKNLDYLKKVKDKIRFICASVLDFAKLTEVFIRYQEKIEGIIHTVAVTADPALWGNPHQGLAVNLTGTINMLELARLFKIKKFVFASSGAVYGKVRDNPSELTHSLHPSDLYGASKAAAELIGQQYENHFGLDFRSARLYFFFGPGRLPSQQTQLFKTLLGPLEGLPNLKLEKGADQKLGFTYVKDAAYGTYLLYKSRSLQHKSINISSERPISFLEMISLAQKYSDKPTQVQIGPGKLFPRGETLDISLAKEELGFSPQYTVEEGMREYARWVKKNKV
ncbi:MAG: NAD-dependent epimerase/dehydratase family protein [bacterium]